MFLPNLAVAPISMIITNLAARAYEGEPDVYAALTGIVNKMPQFVRSERPRVPNPANPAEDYADKWAQNRNLERSFWRWHTQVRADLKKLASIESSESLRDEVARAFAVTLRDEQLSALGLSVPAGAPAIVHRQVVTIPKSAPRPWGN
jgi:hypothetical protein